MNDTQRKDVSIYQLALRVEAPPQPLHVNPATLLSLVRSQIDLLIEQQIAATLWVKLPPGKIWQSELLRYQSSVGAVCYYLYLPDWEMSKGEAGRYEITALLASPSSLLISGCSYYHIGNYSGNTF